MSDFDSETEQTKCVSRAITACVMTLFIVGMPSCVGCNYVESQVSIERLKTQAEIVTNGGMVANGQVVMPVK